MFAYRQTHSLGIQTYYVQRTCSLQNDGTPSPKPSLHERTHLLAHRQGYISLVDVNNKHILKILTHVFHINWYQTVFILCRYHFWCAFTCLYYLVYISFRTYVCFSLQFFRFLFGPCHVKIKNKITKTPAKRSACQIPSVTVVFVVVVNYRRALLSILLHAVV
jgi:hypothetical protein